MRLNLPILDMLEDAESVLIAGAGGGFDIFAGLPIYFTLREMGKTVHLANLTFSDIPLVKEFGYPHIELLEDQVVGARGPIQKPIPYYPEGYLTEWLDHTYGGEHVVWMIERTGMLPLQESFRVLTEHLETDALILVDGGVDSLMRGDESGPGTLFEDSLTLGAVYDLKLKHKLLACLGFGTEMEEKVCHYHALQNMADLAAEGAFYGSCSLVRAMEAFQQYEAACRYVWEKPYHAKSHISTRIIPAVHGQFGAYGMYEAVQQNVCISLLMALYWFFDADVVRQKNPLVDKLMDTVNFKEALSIAMGHVGDAIRRPHRPLPY